VRKTFDGSNPNPFNVRPGQIWENCDPRNKGAYFQILTIREDMGYAITKRQNGMLGRVKLTRFRAMTNGYRLVRDNAQTT
jgi:hypothetical protein